MKVNDAKLYWMSVEDNKYPGTFDDWWDEIDGVLDDRAKALLNPPDGLLTMLKYPLEHHRSGIGYYVHSYKISAPKDFKPLSVGFQRGVLTCWGTATPEEFGFEHELLVAATGRAVDVRAGFEFVGTAIGPLVWHVWWKR